MGFKPFGAEAIALIQTDRAVTFTEQGFAELTATCGDDPTAPLQITSPSSSTARQIPACSPAIVDTKAPTR